MSPFTKWPEASGRTSPRRGSGRGCPPGSGPGTASRGRRTAWPARRPGAGSPRAADSLPSCRLGRPEQPGAVSAAHQHRQAAGVRMLDRGQVDDQDAGGAEQAQQLLAQGVSRRGAEFPAERGDDVAAAVCRGGKTVAGVSSRGVRHGASGHVSRDRPADTRHAVMAADRPQPGQDYPWRGARRIISRNGDITVRNTPAADRSARGCALVTSDGISGIDGCGGAVPLCALVTSDGIGGTDSLAGAGPLGDGRGRVVAGPGSGRGAAGSGMVPSLGTRGSAAASSVTAG